MKISIQFLTHFFGNTKQDFHSRERFNWASTEVELEEVPKGALELVLNDGWAIDSVPFGNEVCLYNDHYWVVVEATNEVCRGDLGSYGSIWYGNTKTKGVKNFTEERQRQFAWNAFAFKFLDRTPAGFAYSSNPDTLKNYRPGTDIEWDETPVIGERVRRYYEQNLIVVDGLVYCRIETPCYVTEGRIFTPYGGFGDPIIDFERASPSSDRLRARFDPGWRDRGASAIFFNPIPDRDEDPLARQTRALFFDTFSQKPWFRTKGVSLSGKRGTAFQKLKTLFFARYETLDEDVLDEAAELMLVLASNGEQKQLIEAWIDRPIGVIGDLAF